MPDSNQMFEKSSGDTPDSMLIIMKSIYATEIYKSMLLIKNYINIISVS